MDAARLSRRPPNFAVLIFVIARNYMGKYMEKYEKTEKFIFRL